MRQKRVRLAISLILSVVLEAGLSLAYNVASAHAPWPGVLDEIRQYPWPAICVLGAIVMVRGVITGGNDDTKNGADAAGQVTRSHINTVTATAAPTYVAGDFRQVITVKNYRSGASPGERDKLTSEGPATSVSAGPTSAQKRLLRPAESVLYLSAGAAILIAIPVLALKLWSPHAPKAPGPIARTSHPQSRHLPTPAPSAPVATPVSATPTAHPVSEDTPIYQNIEVTIGGGGVDVDTSKFLPSPGLGVRVTEGHTGLTLDNPGYEQGMRLALYSGLSRPSREACIAQLDQVAGNMNGMYTRDAAVGQYVCLRTAEQNIAVIQFKKIGAGTFGPITADITLYRELFAPLTIFNSGGYG